MGKSTLAGALAPKLGAIPGAVLLRSDVIRKRMFDKDPKEGLPVEAYREEKSSQIFETIDNRASDQLAAGRTVIADSVYGRLDQRRTIETVAQNAGIPFAGPLA